jgi:hypothetical protein
VRLEEALEGLFLDLDQIRDVEDRRDLREVFANAELGVGKDEFSHGCVSPPRWQC